MRHRMFVGMALALGVLALGGEARAQHMEQWGAGPWGREGEDFAPRLMALLENDQVKGTLGLTDQQTERLRQLIVDTEKASVKTGAEMALRGIELRELLRADKPDRETVMKKVQEIASLRAEMMMQHVDALLAAKNVLTPEQQKKIRSFIESRGAGGFGRERPWERRGVGPGEHMGGPPEPPHRPPEPPQE